MTGRSRGKASDRAFRAVCVASGATVLVVLALIAVSMTQNAWPVFQGHTREFFTSSAWNPQGEPPQLGAVGFLYGTLVSSAIALALAVPVSLGVALFLAEYAPLRLRRPVGFVVDLLAAVPSVVFGLWGVLTLAPVLQRVYGDVAAAMRPVPGLSMLLSDDAGGGGTGRSFFTAGLILALMVTPIVTSLSRAIYETTPQDQKAAALALGATQWEMVRATIFPHSRRGVVGAVLLGLGRAMGETIAAALVIGSSVHITPHLLSSGDSMAAVIANQFGEATGTFRAALIGLGVFLFGVTILVNLAARVVFGRAD